MKKILQIWNYHQSKIIWVGVILALFFMAYMAISEGHLKTKPLYIIAPGDSATQE